MSLAIPHEALVAFGLASIRLLAFVLTAPFFSNTAIPVRVRGAFALLLAFALAPESAGIAMNAVAIGFAALGEALLGVAMGIAASLVFGAIGLAAEAASIQGGLAAAAAIDPASGAPSVALGTLAEGFALLVFLAVGGHHELLRAVANAFASIPPGGVSLAANDAVRRLKRKVPPLVAGARSSPILVYHQRPSPSERSGENSTTYPPSRSFSSCSHVPSQCRPSNALV